MSSPATRTTALVIIAAAVIISVAMGIRQTFGLFLGPFSFDREIPVTLFAFAVALHNLVWGLAQPFAGAAADRFGSTVVVAFGAVTFALGLALAALAPSGALLVIGLGLLVGIGISCTSFGVVLSAVGRAAAPEKRSMALGIASAGGSVGQVLIVPLAQQVTEMRGLAVSLFVLAALMLATAPLGAFLDRRKTGIAVDAAPAPRQSLRAVLEEAARHPGYGLLTLGFFTCGFQLAFIVTHLPGYLTLCHLPASLSAAALMAIGLFNMVGSWACGWLGGRFRQQHVLGWLYLIRGAALAVFFLVPATQASVLIFAAVMGLTWLGTVPLTSGLVAKVFGLDHLGLLFGVCFLMHQVGSFLGAWMGGLVFDATGSYGPLWIATAIAGFVAAAMHFPISDRPVAGVRTSPAQA